MFSTTKFENIDHLAIAVRNLQEAVEHYTEKMQFELETIRETTGEYSGMRSAVLWSGEFSIVLLEATGENSQIQRFIDEYGPGIQHVAFKVKNIEAVREKLEKEGVDFVTNIINGPGLRQMFTSRDKNSGMMFEYIERTGEGNFLEDNINSLFKQLESQQEF